jgi:signal transduction histidine kinase
MDQPLAMREALRIFRLALVINLTFLALGFLAVLGLGSSVRWAFAVRTVPTLLLAFLVLPPWLERALGRWFLALGLGFDVLIESMESAPFFFEQQTSWYAGLLPTPVVQHLAQAPTVEPFFFLLIPLVLLAWAYGWRGAVLGSSWATVLHLGTGLWAQQHEILTAGFFARALMRITLLYVVPLIVATLARRERQQHAQLEAAHTSLRRHAATVEQLATSRERNRLARDLHDTLAHSLSAIAVQLEALRTVLANDPSAARGAVDDLATLARQGLEESRQAIRALRRDPIETLGLIGALREMLQSFQARTGVLASLSVAGQELDLMANEAQALYRIAEEALVNVERHAAAQQAKVWLAFGADRVDLAIRDDGHGFDPAAQDPDRFGLTGMQERAVMVGATLEVRSHPGGGTEIWCCLKR